MASEFRMVRMVEFADTDMAGIVHFANFFRYMEETEHAFLRSLGLSVHMTVDGRTVGLPRVGADCRFTRPLRYEDRVEIHLIVREKKEKSLSYDFVFRKLEADAAPEVARGSLTVVTVAIDPETGGMKAVPLPAAFVDQIEAAAVE
jgi:YbgC/YbaW family acyl-CoA thioester hydrolase